MNRCKGCNKEIPDDREFCEECAEQDLFDSNIDDDYMEELLNSLSSEEAEDPLDDLLNMMSIDNVSEDALLDQVMENDSNITEEDGIFALDEITQEESVVHDIEQKGADVGDIFSDTLSAISSFQDEEELPMNSVQKKEKKPGFFKKLFGNVLENEEKLQKEAEDMSVPKDQGLADERKEKKKKEKKIKNKEAKTKKEKIQKVKKPKEKAEIIVDTLSEGRINKVGATIAVSFFFISALVIILTMKTFVYSQNINNATDYFKRQKYSEAYSEIQGIKLKEKDKKIFEKISTVMYVHKQLKSYENYVKLEKDPQALDSLLKGLKRYDKYVVAGKELGVKKDLDLIRQQLVESLVQDYKISEKEAYNIIESNTREEYTMKILDITNNK